VLPIGGLKEKLLAAHRGGIKTVLIPQQNVKDLAEIPDNIKNSLEIHPVQWIDEVLSLALASQPQPLPEGTDIETAESKEKIEKDAQATDKSQESTPDSGAATKH
jgi:ATP-dependent Lon protease